VRSHAAQSLSIGTPEADCLCPFTRFPALPDFRLD